MRAINAPASMETASPVTIAPPSLAQSYMHLAPPKWTFRLACRVRKTLELRHSKWCDGSCKTYWCVNAAKTGFASNAINDDYSRRFRAADASSQAFRCSRFIWIVKSNRKSNWWDHWRHRANTASSHSTCHVLIILQTMEDSKFCRPTNDDRHIPTHSMKSKMIRISDRIAEPII